MGFFGGGGASGYPPVTSTAGAVQVGLSGGNTLGTDAINIQSNRATTDLVASATNSIAIGKDSKAFDGEPIGGAIAIGRGATSRHRRGLAIGDGASGWEEAVALGYNANTNQGYCVAVGERASNTTDIIAVAVGSQASTSAAFACAVGGSVSANLRSQFMTRPFGSVYWGGTTTDATATTLNLDASATNRMTIAANTAVMADLFIIARRTDTVDKWFSSRRMVAIRRNNANGTAIIGSVQNVGTDQTEGSPTWSVAITADDTNEALQVQVTGAVGESITWRVMAMYRVV